MKQGLEPKKGVDGSEKQGSRPGSSSDSKEKMIGAQEILEHFPRGIDIFDVEPGCLTVVDLTAPQLDTSTACILFDICMECYLRNDKAHGRVIALDEAHKVS